MEDKMNRLHGSLLALLIILSMLADSVSAAPAKSAETQAGVVTASAVVTPALVSRIGFLASAPVKEVAVKQGDIVEAGQTLIVLNAPDLEFNVSAAKAALHSLQADEKLQSYKTFEVIRHGKKTITTAPPEVRLIANAKVQQAQAELDIAQASLAAGTLTAPYASTVAAVEVVSGELVQPGKTVITLATLDHLLIETTDLSERDITRVQVGNKANIFIEALNANISGKVVAISPMASVVGGDVVFKVTLDFDQQPENLLWGMTAEVTINE